MFFFGIHFVDQRIDQLFDLARIILEPSYARKAHITLRGPYKKRPVQNSKWMNSKVGEVQLTKVQNFFNEHQNTVFLRAEIFGIGDFWYKPDYPDGVPHLSIYDGSDRRFAWQILHTMKNFPWNIRLQPSEMIIIDSKEVLETKYLFESQEFDSSLSRVSERLYSMEKIRSMHDGQRLLILNRICEEIHGLAST